MSNKNKHFEAFDNKILLGIYSYIGLPIIIMLLCWFKFYVSVPCVIALTFCFYKAWTNGLKPVAEPDSFFSIPRWAVIAVIAFLWVFFSGIGGFTFQNGDFNGRNAIFRDLINFNWPVVFDYSKDTTMASIFGNHGMMDYYYAFWLPAAVVGKLFGWQAGNAFLLFWAWLGVMSAIYLLARIVGKARIIIAIVLVFWSGLDIVGYLFAYSNNLTNNLTNNLNIPGIIDFFFTSHKEWWSDRLQYSSNTVQLYWVFNQALPTWIISFLLLNQRNLKLMGFTVLLLIPYGPIPFIGIFAIFVYSLLFGTKGLNLSNETRIKHEFIENTDLTISENTDVLPEISNIQIVQKNHERKIMPKQIKEFCIHCLANVKEVITLPNILSGVVMFLFVLFFSLNTENGSKGLIFDRGILYNGYITGFWQLYGLFCFTEFGFLAIVLGLSRKINKPLLIFTALILLLIPFFYFGRGNDFCMRASIPLLCIFIAMTAKMFCHWERKNLTFILTAVIFILGLFNPISEIYRSYSTTMNSFIAGSSPPLSDRWVSFSNSEHNEDGSKSFIVSNYVVKYDKDNLIIRLLIR